MIATWEYWASIYDIYLHHVYTSIVHFNIIVKQIQYISYFATSVNPDEFCALRKTKIK